jgi:hypothetical protein
LLRSKYEPMVGGFLDPMTVILDEKLLVKAVCEDMVSGIRKIRPQGMGGSRRGTQRVISGGCGVNSVGGAILMEERRFSKSNERSGTSEMAVLISEGSYPRASRRSRKELEMEVKSEWMVLAKE